MAVRKLKGSWWVDFRHGGVRYRKRSPLNTKGGAHEFELTLRARLGRGGCLDDDRPKLDPLFADFASEWLETYVHVNAKPSAAYAAACILRCHLLPWFGSRRLSAIGAGDVEKYKAHKLSAGYEPKSINNHLAVLSSSLGRAQVWGVLDARPSIKMLRGAPPKYDRLAPAESAALLTDRSEPVWNVMILVALRTGMRPNELTSLAWDCVDFGNGTIEIREGRWREHVGSPKNNRVRHAPMSPDVREALQQLPRTHTLVFCNQDGSYLTETQRRSALRRVCRRVGIRNLNWYAFRHTFASTLAELGAPLPVIKELMGHSNIVTTMRYTHVSSASLHQAVALLEADAPKVGQPAVNFEGERRTLTTDCRPIRPETTAQQTQKCAA